MSQACHPLPRWSFGTALIAGVVATGGLVAAPLAAQQRAGRPPAESAPADSPDTDPDIIVTGQRQRGAVIGDIAPEVQLGPADIRSYGVGSVAELLDELAPQTGSIRGRGGESPVVLLNGRRISSFAEIRDLPTEAIARVDILPEEVALKYGYSADQRVVNFVLRSRFRAVTGELSDRIVPAGGGNVAGGDTSLVRIQRDRRFTLAINAQASGEVREDQRDILQTPARRPFDLAGNVSGLPAGAALDPSLGATIAGVPASAALGRPTLGDFAATAGAPNTTDVAPYRTLVPSGHQVTANAVLNRNIFANIAATINARVGYTDSRALLGLPGTSLVVPSTDPFSPFADDVALDRYVSRSPLAQTADGLTGHLGLTLNRDIARWRLSLTGTYDYARTLTRTDGGIDPAAAQAALDRGDPAFNPFGAFPPGLLGRVPDDRARSTSNGGGADFVATGPLLTLPAGAATTTVKLGASASDFTSASLRGGVAGAADISRRQADGQVNLDLPLTSRRQGVLAAIGDLSINANAAVHQLSDFGTLTTYGYGLHWTPVTAVSLIVSTTSDDGAPTAQQLGNPLVRTPAVRVFDYATGQTVDVTRIDGGNPDLRSDNRRVSKIGLTLKPLPKTSLSLSANYVASRIRNVIAAFPAGSASPEIEAAFPERFVRDATGQLVAFDSRPVNFAREDRKDLRIGIDFSQPLKSRQQEQFAAFRRAREAAAAASPGRGGTDRPPGSPDGAGRGAEGRGPGGGGGSRGGGGGPGGGAGGGRLQFAVYYTLHLKDDVLIRDGVPALDLLNGSATGSSGGQPRHEIEAQAGFSRDGLGARLSATWRSGSVVRGPDAMTEDDLRFSPLGTVALRLFSDLGQLPGVGRAHPWLRGARVTVALTNILDQRLRVRDASGATPIGYQPDLIDPLGRTVKVTVRKLFY